MDLFSSMILEDLVTVEQGAENALALYNRCSATAKSFLNYQLCVHHKS